MLKLRKVAEGVLIALGLALHLWLWWALISSWQAGKTTDEQLIDVILLAP